MKKLPISVALVYLGFFGLIGFVCWWTDSAVPLWALLFMPSYKN